MSASIGATSSILPSGAIPGEVTISASGELEVALLPDPVHALLSSGDPGAELAMLVLESAKEDKAIGRSVRDAEERAQRVAEDAQLKQLEEKADNAFAAGMFGGFTSVLSGVISVGGAGAVAHAAERGQSQASAVQLRVDGGVKLTEGSGKLGSTAFQDAADDAENAATHEEQIAGRHKRAAEDARDQVKDAKDLIDRTIAFYKEYATSKSDAQRAAFLRA